MSPVARVGAFAALLMVFVSAACGSDEPSSSAVAGGGRSGSAGEAGGGSKPDGEAGEDSAGAMAGPLDGRGGSREPSGGAAPQPLGGSPASGSVAGAASGEAGREADAGGGLGGAAGSDLGGAAGGDVLGGEAGAGGEAPSGTPTKLSETGLYSDISSQTLAADVHAFQPQYAMWADGATSRRFIHLPAASQINTTDMDFWSYPVGTKAWQEISVGALRVETRLLEKLPGGEWFAMAFKWTDVDEAYATPNGEVNALATQHDIPSTANCVTCHSRMADKLLGFSALQLSHELPGINLQDLIDDGKLSAPPAGPFALPGTAVDVAALGYLHGNCGGCHNSQHTQVTNLTLWEATNALASVAGTVAYATAVDANQQLNGTGKLIAPQSPQTSSVYTVLSDANLSRRMPPLGSKTDDATGMAAVLNWINSL